jgi:hypothetical protein
MSVYVSATLRRQVRDRFGDRCAYCQTSEHLTATLFEVGHVVPRARGGTSDIGNPCLACPMCNRFKSDSTSAIDAATGTPVPLFHPNLQQWIDHLGWSDDKQRSSDSRQLAGRRSKRCE